jgi:Ribosomal L28e protein family
MAYSDLIWNLIKHNSAFVVKSQTTGGAILTSDPLSATGRHSLKNSGLAADSATGISSRGKGGLNVVITRPRVWKNNGKNGFKNFNFSRFVASGTGAAKVNN